MRKCKSLDLRLHKPWLFRNSIMDDQITCLNLIHYGHILKFSRVRYQRCVDPGLLDDCDFNLIVVDNKFNPPFPNL